MISPDPSRGKVHINFGATGNSQEFVAEGWSGSETAHRSTIGKTSSLIIPPLDFPGDALITFNATPFLLQDSVTVQKLSIFLNGVMVDEFALSGGLQRY